MHIVHSFYHYDLRLISLKKSAINNILLVSSLKKNEENSLANSSIFIFLLYIESNINSYQNTVVNLSHERRLWSV